MSGAAPTSEEILQAVEASGYLMEQEVASRLEAFDFHVQTARAFQDVEEGKSREIDVWAINRFFFDEADRIAGYSEIIAECKNSANPFVFITRNKSAVDQTYVPTSMRFPIAEYEGRKDLGGGRAQLQTHKAFRELGFDNLHHVSRSTTKAVQFCRIDRNGSKWSANHSGLYDAIFFPLLKSLQARMKETAPRDDSDFRYTWFFYPIVVVRGKLFKIDSTADDKTPIEVPHVPFIRELKSKVLEGRFLVDFVNEDHLDDFVRDVVRTNEAHMIELLTSDRTAILTKERPWRESSPSD